MSFGHRWFSHCLDGPHELIGTWNFADGTNPELKLTPEKGPWPRLLVFPLLLFAALGLGLARLFPDLTYRLAHCPVRDTTGVPCLTCGGTHSIVAIMRGDFVEALVANPLISLGTVFLLIWAVFAIVATVLPRFRRSLEMRENDRRATKYLVALILIGNWIWLIWQFR